MLSNTLEKIFGSRIRAKLLGWFFTHPDEQFFVRQLSIILKEDSTNLSREMKRLGNLRILTSATHGNLKHFQVNRECAFFNEMKGLVLKTAGVAGQIKAVFDTLDGIEYAFIYGSYAKGEENAQSDIDLMVVGDIDLGKLDFLLGDLEKKLGRTINYVVYDAKEFKTKNRARDGFIMDVLAGRKIMITGKEDGLT
ncbi:MAG: nucleotidyltransferase domain-containing protein [Proteobacteria bacterium]|nr:nucleotidyltransferase domain-containing protein [Pseudomonadota bacterium]